MSNMKYLNENILEIIVETCKAANIMNENDVVHFTGNASL